VGCRRPSDQHLYPPPRLSSDGAGNAALCPSSPPPPNPRLSVLYQTDFVWPALTTTRPPLNPRQDRQCQSLLTLCYPPRPLFLLGPRWISPSPESRKKVGTAREKRASAQFSPCPPRQPFYPFPLPAAMPTASACGAFSRLLVLPSNDPHRSPQPMPGFPTSPPSPLRQRTTAPPSPPAPASPLPHP